MCVFIKKSLRRSGKRRKIHRTEFLLSLYLFSFVFFFKNLFSFFLRGVFDQFRLERDALKSETSESADDFCVLLRVEGGLCV